MKSIEKWLQLTKSSNNIRSNNQDEMFEILVARLTNAAINAENISKNIYKKKAKI
jgi:hypothetical protein